MDDIAIEHMFPLSLQDSRGNPTTKLTRNREMCQMSMVTSMERFTSVIFDSGTSESIHPSGRPHVGCSFSQSFFRKFSFLWCHHAMI